MSELPSLLWKFVKTDTLIKHILGESVPAMRWSSPIEFNDPFDCQTDASHLRQQVGFKEALAELMFKKMMCDDIPETAPKELLEFGIGIRNGSVERIHLIQMVETLCTPAHSRQQVLARYYRILCLTEELFSIPMWSYYAENHTGVAIELDPLILADHWLKSFRFLHKVTYAANVPVLYSNVLSFYNIIVENESQLSIHEIQKIFTTKSASWGHEKEWRFVFIKDDCENEIDNDFRNLVDGIPLSDSVLIEDLSFPVDAIKGFVLGCRFPQKKVAMLESALIKQNLGHVKVRRMLRSPSAYLLKVDRPAAIKSSRIDGV